MPRHRITDEYALVKRKGSERWYLEWRERGEKVRRATGTESLAQARIRARELILEAGELRDEAPEAVPVEVVLRRYQTQRGDGLPSSDVSARAVALWIEHWGDASVADLLPGRQEAFVAWLRGKGYSEGYVRRVLAVGKAALNRAWKRQEIARVPFVDLPAISDPYPHYATNEQLAALLNAIDQASHLWTYVLIRLNTGCRGDAALELQPFQVDQRAGLIWLNPPGRAQTKKHRPVVPLTDTLRAVLAPIKATPYVNWHGEPVKSLRTTWRKLRARAGLPEWFAPKVLRHTVATELRRRGVPGWEVSGLLGHRGGESHRTTEVYAKFDPAYLGRARTGIDAWMRELAKIVPGLRGVTAGSVRKLKVAK